MRLSITKGFQFPEPVIGTCTIVKNKGTGCKSQVSLQSFTDPYSPVVKYDYKRGIKFEGHNPVIPLLGVLHTTVAMHTVGFNDPDSSFLLYTKARTDSTG